jgi:tRNA-2-methylthio-N6-dimethylallyladenosine synthase
MNYADSERLETVLENVGLQKTEILDEADVVFINTCSIKQHAEDRVHGLVHNVKKQGKLVGLTGCMVRKSSSQKSEHKDALLKKHEKIDFVFRIEEMGQIPDLLQEYFPKIARPQIAFNELDYLNIRPKRPETFRAFVPIMTGCDKFCTYCIVPYARGRERSRKMQDVLQECVQHVQNGTKEIILVGQNVNAYFLDDETRKPLQQQTDFATLLDVVAEISQLQRLRFTSPHPRHMGEDVLQVMAKHKNIARTIHLPVQSGSSKVLKRMGREHRIETFKKITKRAREIMPDITITTDIIVGFCGETEEDFNETVRLFDEEQFLMAYISKYSERKGTFAAHRLKDDVSKEEKKRRFAILTEKLRETAKRENKKVIGKREYVLIDAIEDGVISGKTHTGRSAEIFAKAEEVSLGQIVPLLIEESGTWTIRGSIVKNSENIID